MRGTGARLANNLWQISCLPAWYQFRRATASPEQVQHRILRDYLVANQDTEFGRRFGFASITSVESFQRSVPITTYEDYLEPIEAIGRGQRNVLTVEPVTMFEITSGSSSASKLIPYTRSLRSEFQRAIATWIANLFRHYPDLKKGPAYWSITPLVEGRQTTPGGIPIGFEEDSAYLGLWSKRLVDAALVVPSDLKNVQDIELFRYLTLLFLLRQPDLRLISIWNPTFLSLLLASLSQWWQGLLNDIANGTLSPPNPINPELRESLLGRLSPDPHRALALAPLRSDDYLTIWPHLGLISCWMDGPAAPYAKALQTRLPDVLFQGKGLIATEAFVSFPVIGVAGGALAITSHFFEFLPVDSQTLNPSSAQPKLAHQLEEGQIYTIVVTTGGGFYRYHLQDIVEVIDHFAQVPCLRFLGRGDKVSDWFGEKLHEQFVARVLEELLGEYGISPLFAMLAPDDSQDDFRYILYLELSSGQRSKEVLAGLASDLDQRLRRNFHYDYCRKLGQLASADVHWIAHGALEAYLGACRAQGQRMGDIKPSPLQKTTGWGDRFSRGNDQDALS